jgi:hypothetical protein
MKKALLVAAAVVLAPLVLVGVAAFAAGDWRPIGATAAGDRVSESGLRNAWIRIQYKEPTRLPQGGPFVELRARVRFNCATGSALPTSEWLYSRDRSGQIVVSKKLRRDDQFGQPAEGGFGEMAREFVCKP